MLRDTLGFRGVAITDALTMEGVGKGYTTEQSSVLAVVAGADILLKPSDPTRAIDAVVAAVERGEISRARIDAAVRRVLELKVRAGVTSDATVSLTRLREVVGSSEHRALAASVAQRSLTLLRDRDHLVPLPADAGRTLLIRYAPETEIKAGRTFESELRALMSVRSRGARLDVARIAPGATRDVLDSLDRIADAAINGDRDRLRPSSRRLGSRRQFRARLRRGSIRWRNGGASSSSHSETHISSANSRTSAATSAPTA